MQHTATTLFHPTRIKAICALVISSFLISPLTASAMFLDHAKRQALCQERALEAQERQIQSAENLVNNTVARLGNTLDQYSKDVDFVMNFQDEVTSVYDDVMTNVMAIVAGNITLDIAGLSALKSVAKNAYKAITKIQKFITRMTQIKKRWTDIPKNTQREINRVKSYANNIAKQTYSRAYSRCMTGW